MKSKALKATPPGRAWLYFSIAVFMTCLCFETVYLDNRGQPGISHFGFEMLLTGAWGLLVGEFAWLANPLLLVAWVLVFFGNRLFAAVLGCIALLLAFTFLASAQMPADINGASGTQEIVSYGAGYWLWLVSISAAIIATVPSKRNQYAMGVSMTVLLLLFGMYTLAVSKQDRLLLEKAAAIGESDELVIQQIGKVKSIELVHGAHQFNRLPSMLLFKAIGSESTINVFVEVRGSRFHPIFRHSSYGMKRLNE
jgi:hypothetical protein